MPCGRSGRIPALSAQTEAVPDEMDVPFVVQGERSGTRDMQEQSNGQS